MKDRSYIGAQRPPAKLKSVGPVLHYALILATTKNPAYLDLLTRPL